MDDTWTTLGAQTLVIIGPIFLAVLTAVILWIARIVAGILKTKWGVDIDVAELQKELAKVEIGKREKDMLHSAIETGVAQVLDEIAATQATPIAGIAIPPAARNVIMQHLRKSIPGTLAALSPLPDVIDGIAIRYATELLAKRRLAK